VRRTFVTLAQVDGAPRDVLKVITHGVSEADIVDMYTSVPWPTLCEAVARLRVPISAGRHELGGQPEVDATRAPDAPVSAAVETDRGEDQVPRFRRGHCAHCAQKVVRAQCGLCPEIPE